VELPSCFSTIDRLPLAVVSLFPFRMISDTLHRSKISIYLQQSQARWKCGKAAAFCSFTKRLESDKYQAHLNLSVPDQCFLGPSFPRCTFSLQPLLLCTDLIDRPP
jgi:hypothetical protein